MGSHHGLTRMTIIQTTHFLASRGAKDKKYYVYRYWHGTQYAIDVSGRRLQSRRATLVVIARSIDEARAEVADRFPEDDIV